MDDAGVDPRRWPTDRLLARLYDWEHDAFEDDLQLYASLAQRTGGPVLEAACGTGRVLAPLAAQGLEVIGFDASAEMLARASRRLAPFGSRVALSQSSLGYPLPKGEFGLIILALDALGLVHATPAQLELLRRIRDAMTFDGCLVLDLVHVAPLADQPQGVPVLQRSSFDEEIGAQVTKWIVRTLSPATQELTLDCFYDVSWPDRTLSRVEESIRLRYFGRHELQLLLERAGLAVEGLYGTYDLEPFRDDSARMIAVVARGR